MLLKGTYTVDNIPTYEQYGVSPSPDYPSEVETVNGSVKIDVVNKNLALWNENNISFINVINNSISNNVISVKGNEGTAALGYSGGVTRILFDRELRLNKSYTLSVKVKLLEQGKWSNQIQFWFGSNTSWSSETKVVELATNKYILCTFEFKCKIDKENTLTVYLNGNEIEIDLNSLQIEEGTIATDFVEHQSQTAIMPIQQEMLDGDYVANVEHHEWKKSILTGEEELSSNFNINGSIFFGAFISDKDTNNGEMVCNNYLYQPNKTWQQISNYGFCGQKGSNNVFIRDDRFTTKTDFLNYLKQQYEAGTPVTISYKLATPVNLKLTEGQKTVREQKLYTYKNITNIDVSDELASIDVTYKKDLETEHNKLQNQIDEIKQLLSTTQTSALLLDNLQKDVESEVK